MNKLILPFALAALVGLVGVPALVLFIPAAESNWLPRYLIEASPEAKELAEALSTPPTHLQEPMRYAMYHWQTLIAGVLAYLGGLAAVVAAFVGANALRQQTEIMAKATRDAASTQANAMYRQADQASSALQMQINRDDQHREQDGMRQRQQIASAISGELRVLHEIIDFKVTDFIFEQDGVAFINTIGKYFAIPRYGAYSRVFSALGDKIGILPVSFPADIARAYGYASGTFENILVLADAQRSKNGMGDTIENSSTIAGDIIYIKSYSDRLSRRLEHYSTTRQVLTDDDWLARAEKKTFVDV